MESTSLALLGVPSSAGARRGGQEEAPTALRAAGLVTALTGQGFTVSDRGDLDKVVFRPDAESPNAQNIGLVRRVARAAAVEVAAVRADGALPVVLGGDCTISLGVVAGLLEEGSSLGVLYLDADLDLNTPETSPSGILEGMVTAHLLGRGDGELAGIGPRTPLLPDAHLAYFGYSVEDGGIDPPELDALDRIAALRYPIESVRMDPRRTAREARAALEQRVDRILVHFDVDVTDTKAVDVPHPSGLGLDTAASVLEVLLSSPKLAGLVVTELNPVLDTDGSATRGLAARLAAALAAARAGPAGARGR